MITKALPVPPTNVPLAASQPSGPLQATVQNTLRQTTYRPLWNVTCHCTEDGSVRVEGCVPSYYLKQVTQTLLMQLEDVTRVYNNLEVAGSETA